MICANCRNQGQTVDRCNNELAFLFATYLIGNMPAVIVLWQHCLTVFATYMLYLGGMSSVKEKKKEGIDGLQEPIG